MPGSLMRADEFLRQLEADPEWVARRDARERDRLEREERSRREQSTLLAELAATGISVADVWDLVNTAQPYPQALPVLLAHLSKPYSAGVLDGIARALAIRRASFTANARASNCLGDASHRVAKGIAPQTGRRRRDGSHLRDGSPCRFGNLDPRNLQPCIR